MRVATDTFSNNLIDQLSQLEQRQNQLQNQAVTGRKISLPEDDPAAMQQVLNLQAQSAQTAQYQNNISQLQGLAATNYNAINGLKTISDRAGEIATLADGTKSPADLANYATEVSSLIQQAAQLANSKDSSGNYLFAGTSSNTAPFVVTTDSSGLVTGVAYQGNTSTAQSEIAQGVTVSAQVLGANTTGSGPRGLITDSRHGADFLNHLISLQNDLKAGNTSAISATDAPALSKDEDNIIFQISANGALQSRLQATSNIASQQTVAIDGQVSQKTSVDLAQTLTEFSQAQNAYTAALQSGARILNTSLLDYLK
jgi:flagellar hook-associated protein 3 FlgL